MNYKLVIACDLITAKEIVKVSPPDAIISASNGSAIILLWEAVPSFKELLSTENTWCVAMYEKADDKLPLYFLHNVSDTANEDLLTIISTLHNENWRFVTQKIRSLHPIFNSTSRDAADYHRKIKFDPGCFVCTTFGAKYIDWNMVSEEEKRRYLL